MVITTSEGKHIVQAKLGWIKTPTYSIDIDDRSICYFQSKGVFSKYYRIIWILNSIGLFAFLSPLKHIIYWPLVVFQVGLLSVALGLLVFYLFKGAKNDIAFFSNQ